MPNTEDEEILHDLAFLYFTMAYGADRDLDESELAMIQEKLSGRYPDLDQEVIDRAASSALRDYMDADDPMDEAGHIIEELRDRLPEPGLRLVYADLERVAEADGQIVEREQDLLNILVESWDLA